MRRGMNQRERVDVRARPRGRAFWLCTLLLLCCLSVGAAAALFPQASEDGIYKKSGTTLNAGNASEGYVMVKRESGKEQRVRIAQGKQTFTYHLRGDGEYEVYPLQLGSGKYDIRVYEQVKGTQYAQVYAKTINAKMEDENLAFLYPNQYVWYTADSGAIPLSQSVCEGAQTDSEKLTAIYTYIIKHISYDYIKMATVKTGYMPDIEDTIETGTGICFDIASLMAAMLRIQGVPTQIAIGSVGNMAHAWNRVYLDGKWSIVDATLVAMNYTKKMSASDYKLERYY